MFELKKFVNHIVRLHLIKIRRIMHAEHDIQITKPENFPQTKLITAMNSKTYVH